MDPFRRKPYVGMQFHCKCRVVDIEGDMPDYTVKCLKCGKTCIVIFIADADCLYGDGLVFTDVAEANELVYEFETKHVRGEG